MGSEEPNFSSFDLKASRLLPRGSVCFCVCVCVFVWWRKGLRVSAAGRHFVCGPRQGVGEITICSLVRGFYCYY